MFRKLLRYFWGMIVHPLGTLDELAQEPSIRSAALLVISGLLLTLLNLLFFTAFGFDWLGTRRELPDPTYVGFFGRLPVGTENYVTIFNFLINPVMALTGLIFVPGLAQLLSKLWGGRGTFEQMVNTIVFAVGMPSIVISSTLNDLLLGVSCPTCFQGIPIPSPPRRPGNLAHPAHPESPRLGCRPDHILRLCSMVLRHRRDVCALTHIQCRGENAQKP